jgi:hypothetical protein
MFVEHVEELPRFLDYTAASRPAAAIAVSRNRVSDRLALSPRSARHTSLCVKYVVTTYESGDLRANVRVKSHWLVPNAVEQTIRTNAHNGYRRVSEGAQACAVMNDNNGSPHGDIDTTGHQERLEITCDLGDLATPTTPTRSSSTP